MKKLQVTVFAASLVLLAFSSACFADTFTHRGTDEVLHGYATSQTAGNETFVRTQEKGVVKLNLAEWQITADQLGRNNRVIVLKLDDQIALEIETEALEQAIAKLPDEGPLFVLLEIDTPGGRTDLTQRICGAITQERNCRIFAFVKGGEYGGAISAGAAVALACDKIYMAENTIIGAAATITFSKTGQPEDLKKAFGEDVAEKFSSAWQAKLASLAEQNGRPGLLARAMVDKDIEAIEVSEAGKRFFIDPVNRKSQQQLVHTWSKKGSLLTLTAAEALRCGIADKVVNSQQELLRDLGADSAEIVINDSPQKARERFERVKRRFDKLRKSLDFKNKQLEHQKRRQRALGILRTLIRDYKSLITLAKNYPDLHMDIQAMEEELNSIEATYKEAKVRR